MELEVSYNENYCLEGRAERQRGAIDRDDGGGQAVGTDCVDRHTLFITPLSSCRDADLRRAHHEPSAYLSHDQLGQLRRRGWGERAAAQPL